MDKITRAVIMAGGKGTRLSEITKDEIPKPMVPVLDKPILEYQIEFFKNNGITDITIVVGHLREKIQNYFNDGSAFGVKISYIEETEPLGSAGALFYLKNEKNDFFVAFGDTIFDIDIKKMENFHFSNNAAITLLAHPNSHPYDSDIVCKDGKNKVTELLSKKAERIKPYHNLVNAAFFIISPKIFANMEKPVKLDMEKDVITKRIPSNDVFCYVSTEYIKDAGTVDRLSSVGTDILSGTVSSRNLSKKQKAIFLDRDGTINKYLGFITDPKDIELLPKVADAIKKINAGGYLAVVVSNQPVIARGDCTFEQLDEIHKTLETLLGKEGAYLDAIYFCPHHPHKGFDGEVAELKFDCDCRKPKIGLLKQAERDWNIDLTKSWFVGDSIRDVETGKNANMNTIKLTCGIKEDGDGNADYVCDNLFDAVSVILGK